MRTGRSFRRFGIRFPIRPVIVFHHAKTGTEARLCYSMNTGAFPDLTRLKPKAGNSPPLSTCFENMWSITYTPHCSFIACCVSTRTNPNVVEFVSFAKFCRLLSSVQKRRFVVTGSDITVLGRQKIRWEPFSPKVSR